ncbi:MAG: hypothetical protein F7B20_00585 [Aeropyrum sp.]|nr:hypothetical protein [Aeropyrum sp.]MCE4616192.1 hypothetical protein [Aeropyrum sp.]
MIEIDKCSRAASEIASRLRINSIEGKLVSPGGQVSPRPSTKIVEIFVKDPVMPSFDERPILSALRLSLAKSGLISTVRQYESPSGPREEKLAQLIVDSLSRGTPFIAVVPSLLAIGLASRLPQHVIDVLEGSHVVEVVVDFRNLLYLPVPEVNDLIEIVGKKNSAASYERIRKLEEIAGSVGIKVRGHTLLNSNGEILDYLASGGPNSIYHKVPVTKLALYINVLSLCAELDLDLVEIGEKAIHTIYLYRLDSETVDTILGSINSVSASPSSDESLATQIKEGASIVAKALGISLPTA